MIRRTFLSLIAATVALPLFAQESAVFVTDDVAINGYDTVAYFEQGMPVAGNLDYAVDWNDAVWLFSSAENMQLFESDPEAYAPQYGGYCAYALSKGALASTDPNAWTIYDGKLYLNYSINVRGIWSEDIPGNIALADGYWPGIVE